VQCVCVCASVIYEFVSSAVCAGASVIYEFVSIAVPVAKLLYRL